MSWHIAIYLIFAGAFGVNLGVALMAMFAARGEGSSEGAGIPQVIGSPAACRSSWGFSVVGSHRAKNRRPRTGHGCAKPFYLGRIGRRLRRGIA